MKTGKASESPSPPASPPPQTWAEEAVTIGTGAGPAWNQQVAVGGHAVRALPATDNPAQEGKLLASRRKQCCHHSHGAFLEADLEGDQGKDSFPGWLQSMKG